MPCFFIYKNIRELYQKKINYSKSLVSFPYKKKSDLKIVLNKAKIKKISLIKLFNL